MSRTTSVTAAWRICAEGCRARRRVAGAACALLGLGSAAAGPDTAGPLRHVPNDPRFAEQWYLDNAATGADINAPEAWSITRGSPAIVIAVLDDGIETTHPDLAANVSPDGWDFVAGAAGATPKNDRDRHGTAVAGIAAARGDDGIGIAGACPHCTILPIRIDRDAPDGVAAAFGYAVSRGADIITNSWGYTRATQPAAFATVATAVADALAHGRAGRGSVVVFGMTNVSVDNCAGPNLDTASLPGVLAVGVADHEDGIGGSGYGACMSLVAPAKPRFRSSAGMLTTDRSGVAGYSAHDYHESFGGTSAAAPLVAGAAGLLLSLNPELSATEVRRILEHTADEIDPVHAQYDQRGYSPRAGHGRLNAGRALRPAVRIRVHPSVVTVGETFSITVTASAPLGVEQMSWRGHGTGGMGRHDITLVEPQAYYERTWRGLTLPTPGTFRFEAQARGARYADRDGYPHEARTSNVTLEGLLTVLAVSP